MPTWSCVYCTLVNDSNFTLCQGCGSRNPGRKSKKGSSIIPKSISNAVKDVSNAITEMITSNKRPTHHIVRIPETPDRVPIPNGPFIDNSANGERMLLFDKTFETSSDHE
ncbi:unnamed protein product [Caenorhabditis bovis]|uniref:RanBP2-type domain-containing protein n=1 Tax=Caenorhabditis bovis TaxID=2654633 RepID=A0A8S1E929_9PELO|nr:unnamed protein product [Caenorhabditis bovis]